MIYISKIQEWIGKNEDNGEMIQLLKKKVAKIERKIDYDKAEKIFNFIETFMTLPDNRKFKIIPYHKAVLTIMYCTPFNIKECVVIVGRSNAKSILDVMIALIELFLFPKPNAVIALMATKKDQAQKNLDEAFPCYG